MRVAIVHDYIKEYGGAERVLEALHEIYPDAPIYTSLYLPKFLGPHKKRFEGWNIKTSFAQYFPFKQRLISPLRILAPLLFKQFDFSEFDVVIVSATGAYASNMIHKGTAIHICYCHTPPRYLYGYSTARDWKKNIIFRVIGEIANHFLRMVDFNAAQNVDHFVANSNEVASRIKKFYRREAAVIYPPVESAEVAHENFLVRSAKKGKNVKPDNYSANAHSENFVGSPRSKKYFLAGGRLARSKHIDLIVRACRELNAPLIVFGRGFADYGGELKKIAGETVEFLGEVSDLEKLELMKNAKAYLFASLDEDFGITPVEAMSMGTPVIAYRSGGVKETVIEGKTGLFYDELSPKSLIKAIQQFNRTTFKPEECVKQAEKFSKERFKKEITEFVNNCH